MTTAVILTIIYFTIAVLVAIMYYALSYISYSVCKSTNCCTIFSALPKRHVIRMVLECSFTDWGEYWDEGEFFGHILGLSFFWPVYFVLFIMNMISYNVSLRCDVQKHWHRAVRKMVIYLNPAKKKKAKEA